MGSSPRLRAVRGEPIWDSHLSVIAQVKLAAGTASDLSRGECKGVEDSVILFFLLKMYFLWKLLCFIVIFFN